MKLLLGDCIEIMKTLPDNSVDAVITDPPFGINFKYSQHNDSPIGYGKWLWSAIEGAERICRPGGAIFVWQAMPNVRYFSGWFPRNYRIFAACKNFVQMRKTAMQYSFDPVIVWWKEGGDIYYKGTAGRDYFIANTSPSCRKKGSINYVDGHPCPRPLDQVLHIVDQWVRPGSTILDPFMGSGTTGVSAKMLGNKFVGIEIDDNYYKIAEARIASVKPQKSLFIDTK